MSNSAFRIHTTGLARTDYFLADQDLTYTDPASGPGLSAMPQCHAGGLALVSAAVASQFLRTAKIPVTYYGISGDDANASGLRHLLAQTPLDLTCFRQKQGITPSTRMSYSGADSKESRNWLYRHDPGTVAWDVSLLGESFFQATVNVYAATHASAAWHRQLPELLVKGRRRGALNVVALGFDPAAATTAPEGPMDLGWGNSYTHIDLLVVAADCACPITGKSDISESITALIQKGLSAVIVAHASGSIEYRSQGGVFGQSSGQVPINPELLSMSQGRSNCPSYPLGVGDTFLAGLLSDLMLQILADDFYPKGELHIERELLEICPLRLRHAIEFASVAASLARLEFGGLQIEAYRGERLAQVRNYFPDSAPVGRPW